MARMAPLPDFDAEQLDRLDAVNHQRIINAARKLEHLHRIRADKYGKLWVTSRGDYDLSLIHI